MELHGRRKRGRPRRKKMGVTEDMEAVGVTGRMWKTGGEVERYDPLWQPLTGLAQGRRRMQSLHVGRVFIPVKII